MNLIGRFLLKLQIWRSFVVGIKHIVTVFLLQRLNCHAYALADTDAQTHQTQFALIALQMI